MILVSIIVYSVTQRSSTGGVHDRTAKMRYRGENSGLSGEEGGPKLDGSYESNLLS